MAQKVYLTVQQIRTELEKLGVESPVVNTDDVDFFLFPYLQQSRYYHSAPHGADMARMSLFAGWGHDGGYLNIDGAENPTRPLAKVVADRLAGLIDCSKYEMIFNLPVYTVQVIAPKEDSITNLACDIFGIGETRVIKSNQGGNEFVSALATAKWQYDKGVPLKVIAADLQIIAGTVPFKDSKQSEAYPYEDGYMGCLYQRLVDANAKYVLEMSDKEIYRATVNTCTFANKDVSDFKDSWIRLVHAGFGITQEMNPPFRDYNPRTVQQLMIGTHGGLYGMIEAGNGPVKAENVFHTFRNADVGLSELSDDPRQAHEIATRLTKKHSGYAAQYMRFKRVGIALTAAIAAFVDEKDASVPGFVNRDGWSNPRPFGERKANPPEDEILNVLKFGRGENTDIGGKYGYEVSEAPISAFIYEMVGRETMVRLAEEAMKVKSFDIKEDARKYIKLIANEIGADNLKIVLNELARVARHPDAKLGGGENEDRAQRIEQVAARRLVSCAESSITRE